MKLSRDKQNAARGFIHDRGRPLERSLFAYHFEEGFQDNVLAELMKFQNPDGGFGHGLEPDFRVPDSSALATSTALQYLRETGAGADNSLVRKAIEYLLNLYDSEHQLWPIIPLHDNTAPHAPWWAYDPAKMARWSERRANPGAQIIAHLHYYRSLAPTDFLMECTEAMLFHLESLPDAMEMHDIGCYVFLAETKSLPEHMRTRIVGKIQRAIDCTLARERPQWESYGLKPLSVVASPDSPFAPRISAEIERNLDYEIERQDADGSWAPNWSWGGAFPKAWNDAEQEWRGVLTLQTLRTLRNFGRLA